ncbi:MAG: DUF177 domain-containing protein [Rhodobacteraceae bacterium]|nr:DUF177 domain-containing protein [Paracoccaceae bacterium]
MDPKQPPRTGGPETRVIRLDALLQRRAHPVALTLTPADHKALAAELDLLGLEKARLTGELRPVGKRDWDFVGTLGATVTQACVVTLAPVRTRIDEPVLRRFRADLSDDVVGDEIEMPEDDSLEPLPETVDLLDLFAESLALSLPAYPRADDAVAGSTVYTEPGKAAMTDDDAKPFAGLAQLRGKLGGDEN